MDFEICTRTIFMKCAKYFSSESAVGISPDRTLFENRVVTCETRSQLPKEVNRVRS